MRAALSPLIPRDLLPGFDACCDAGTFGRLEVPGWGANTMRAEFAVLTGIPESELGYDRFNPYHALARVPIASQVWRLRRAGYRTICLHPFDRRFFRRDLAMPALGFETLSRHARPSAVRGARPIAPTRISPGISCGCSTPRGRAASSSRSRWAITAHGARRGRRSTPSCRAEFRPGGVPQGGELLRYLDGLRRSDEMLRILMAGLQRRGEAPVLGVLRRPPAEPAAGIRHFGFDEPHADYVIWTGGGMPERPCPSAAISRRTFSGRP